MIRGVSEWFQIYGFADVHDNLLVGAYPLDISDVRILERVGVRRVLNLVEDQEYAPGTPAPGCGMNDWAVSPGWPR